MGKKMMVTCDRCGTTDEEGKETRLSNGKRYPYKNEWDLCPPCYRLLLQWMKNEDTGFEEKA